MIRQCSNVLNRVPAQPCMNIPSSFSSSSSTSASLRRLRHNDTASTTTTTTTTSLSTKKRLLYDALPETGKRLIDDGIYETMEAGTYNRFVWFAKYKQEHCVDARDVHELALSLSMIAKLRTFSNQNCPHCLFIKIRCICPYIQQLQSQSKLIKLQQQQQDLNIQLWLFQTIGEFGRNNNSGSLLTLIANARRVMRGWRTQEDYMIECLEKNQYNAAIIFPSDSSCTVKEFEQLRRRKNLNNKVKQQEKDMLLHLVVLDGTPNEAKNMDRFLPTHIPRIRLDTRSRHSWYNNIREQSQQERVCTAQAVAVILDGLGQVQMARDIEQCVYRAVDINETDRARYLPNPS